MNINSAGLAEFEPQPSAQHGVARRREVLRIFLSLALALIVIGLPSVSALSSGWNATSPMPTSRYASGAVVLPSGKVLVVGGHGLNNKFATRAEIYDPLTKTWVVTSPLPSGHRYTATLLKTGEVLVVGDDTLGSANPTAYLYNETKSIWIATGAPSIGRYSTTVTLLPSGNVLMAGGYNGGCCSGLTGTYNSAEIYNREKNSWSPTADMNARRLGHTATLLPSGKVLVAGGTVRDPVSAHNSAEIYDPATGAWSSTGPMTTPRFFHKATLLPSGKVLVTGGFRDVQGTSLASAEIYNPLTGIWASVAPMKFGRGRHTSVLLSSGKVLVAGGLRNNSDNASSLDSTELYDPLSGTWSLAGTMTRNRSQHIAVLLASDSVLVAGGLDQTGSDVASAEVYVTRQPLIGELIQRNRKAYGNQSIVREEHNELGFSKP
ncbi:MAG: kelch repeat-containing protein [Blastocatellia bacterium]